LLAQVGVAHRCGFEFESQMILELPPECPQCPLTKQMLPISTLTILPGPQE
jgi:predicted Zn-ribbon and HTH transcriptional regulator